MFLHIGADRSVPVKDIAIILDCEAEMPESTIKTLSTKKSVDAGIERRSAVVTPDKVYYSPIAASTLRKRLNEAISFFT